MKKWRKENEFWERELKRVERGRRKRIRMFSFFLRNDRKEGKKWKRKEIEEMKNKENGREESEKNKEWNE